MQDIFKVIPERIKRAAEEAAAKTAAAETHTSLAWPLVLSGVGVLSALSSPVLFSSSLCISPWLRKRASCRVTTIFAPSVPVQNRRREFPPTGLAPNTTS
jgi:hypothetical protein